jgi:TonB-dependent SusC/RagA subfamily outer membrane receptor
MRNTIIAVSALSLSVACAPAPPVSGAAPRTAPQITAADFRNTSDPIEVIIQRKVPGLTLTRTSNGEPVLRIRGRTTYSEQDDAQPMYVIDGVTIKQANPLGLVSADDIDTITVLKGPEAAIYGTDALNGAIVIVTKRASRRTTP